MEAPLPMTVPIRVPLALAAAMTLVAAWGLPVDPAAASGARAAAEAVSDQSKTQRRTKRQTTGQGQRQIACTQFGCAPIPPGCEIRTGFIPFTWDPSGFDEVVCPYRRPAR
jgi:hypothetical protein